ncbi:glucosyltransferase domain-containing protein [Dyella acidiphila]|uniref:Glucosyltransferase domain-containing protein n=1 Tax=Dyella acidiphila TaxID=2775866 RepID=A0ABR9G4Q3_9GAMM|nr:glucosyltransferase domain-containing protein [Dyella acidiphila]MBE1159023.1 glucosyltransferase domain-containing protein [Dyella acidiphila]
MDSSARLHGRQVFGILFLGYFLFVLYPILRADRPCNDDLARALNGAYAWDINGRPLTTLLMKLLVLKLPFLVDIAPLSQLLAIALLALSGVLIARRYAIASPWLAALLALPLGAQPFFLQSLSFRFDAAPMALSLLLALLPVTLFPRGRAGFWLGAAALFGCLCSYQPSFNVFLLFVLLDLLVWQTESVPPRQLALQALRYSGQAVLALLVYQWKVAPTVREWVQEHSHTIHGLGQLSTVQHNARMMGAYLLDAMPHSWMHIFLPMLLLAAILPLVIGLRYALVPGRPWWLRLGIIAFALLVPCVALLCLAGPMLLLVSPVLAPRVFSSVGALISASLISLYAASGAGSKTWATYLTATFAGIWALGMLTFAGVYGSALAAQQHYEDRIASQLANDLADLKARHGVSQFLLDGSAGYSPLTAHAAAQFHLLDTLVLPYLEARDFNSRNFIQYYGMGMDEVRQDPANDAMADRLLAGACTLPALATRSRYSMRVLGNTAVITLPGGKPTVCSSSP